jgi:hypothetical protein
MKKFNHLFQNKNIRQVRLKQRNIISILVLIMLMNGTFSKAIAQIPFQAFFNDSTLLFKAQNLDFTGVVDHYQKSYYKAAAFDSVVNASGLTFYYPFKTARDTSGQPQGGNCIDINGNSWLGNHFYHDTQMHYQFMNNQSDTIFIHTQENIGHQWICYTYNNGDYLKATITNISLLNLNGINDSVKTIQLNLFDALGNAGSNSWTQKELLISQHYGFIKCPIFNDFPNDTNMVTRQFNLTIATTNDIYDFNVGDKFYYQSYKTNNWPPTEATDYALHEVANKTIDIVNQIVTYTYNVTKYDYNINFPSPPYLDTIIYYTVTNNFPLNTSLGIPEKIAFDSTFGILHHLMQDFNDNGLTLTSPVYVKNTKIYIPSGNNCYQTTITTLPVISKYSKSIGRIYYEEYWNGSGGSAPVSYITMLIGYQKNGVSYGNFLGIENLHKNSAQIFNVICNLSENLNIQWLAKDAGTIGIYDGAGQLIFEKNVNQGNHQFTLPTIVSGLYFVKAISNNNIEVKKFVKQ